MTDAELAVILARFPELKTDGWPNHLPELRQIAQRIIELEQNPIPAVLPPPGLDDAARAEWFHKTYPRRTP